MIKPTVLIVDDEKPTREGLRAALEDRYDVYIAEDGESAVRLIEEDGFDVLLTDLRMPGLGGLDLIKRAKSMGKPPICILMTAYGSEEMAVDAMQQGADDYIAKGRLQIDELEVPCASCILHHASFIIHYSAFSIIDLRYCLIIFGLFLHNSQRLGKLF